MFNEWDRQNVIITGSSDEVVRMWSLDYVEVALNTVLAETVLSSSKGGQPDASLCDLGKKMSVSVSGDCLNQSQGGHGQTEEPGSVQQGQN